MSREKISYQAARSIKSVFSIELFFMKNYPFMVMQIRLALRVVSCNNRIIFLNVRCKYFMLILKLYSYESTLGKCNFSRLIFSKLLYVRIGINLLLYYWINGYKSIVRNSIVIWQEWDISCLNPIWSLLQMPLWFADYVQRDAKFVRRTIQEGRMSWS